MSRLNLQTIIRLRGKAVIKMKDQKLKTSLHLPAALSGCLPLSPSRSGREQTTESASLRQSWGGWPRVTACCVMHDTPRCRARAWGLTQGQQKSSVGPEWMDCSRLLFPPPHHRLWIIKNSFQRTVQAEIPWRGSQVVKYTYSWSFPAFSLK